MFKVGDKVRLKETRGNRAAMPDWDFKAIYHVTRDEQGGSVDVDHPDGKGWYAHRFELVAPEAAPAVPEPQAKAIIPLTAANVKEGMKVAVVDIHLNVKLKEFLNKTVTIKHIDHIAGTVTLEETDGRFYFKRFVLAPESVVAPLARKPGVFIPGDKVKVVDNKHLEMHFKIGDEFTVVKGNHDYSHHLCITIDPRPKERGPAPFRANRFELIAPAAPVVVNKQIKCIEGYRPAHLVAGKMYTIKKEHPKYVLLEEIPGKLFAKRRFEFPVAAPIVPRPIQKGDMVYVVAKDENPNCAWSANMDKYLNDGVAYRVHAIGAARVFLAMKDGWLHHDAKVWAFTPKCLSHTPGGLPVPVAPPPPAPKKDKLTEVMETLRERSDKAKKDGHITNFAIKRVGKEEVVYSINPACYAPINYDHAPIEIFVVDTSKHVHQAKELGDSTPYLQWLFNESPWASCFVTKDVPQALAKGIVMDCNKPIGQLVGAACAVREWIEFSGKSPLFTKLLDAGYHGNTAWLLSRSFMKEGKYYTAVGHGGHTALYTTIEKEELISFFKNGFPDLEHKAANAPGHTKYEINACIGDDYGNKPFSDWIRKETGTKKVGEGWQAKEVVMEKDIYRMATILEPQITKEQK